MIEKNLLWIISLALISLLFVCNIFFAFLNTKLKTLEKFSFKKHFPFESLNNQNNSHIPYLIVIFILTGSLFLPLMQTASVLDLYQNNKFTMLLIGILIAFLGFFYLFLNLIKPTNVKQHLILVILFSICIIAVGLLTFLYSYNLYNENLKIGESSLVNLIMGVASFTLAMFEFISIFTFRLKDWAKLEKGKDGFAQRPNFFSLAAFEWLSLLLAISETILYLLSIVKY